MSKKLKKSQKIYSAEIKSSSRTSFRISHHAETRMVERTFSQDDINFIIENGIFERAEKNRSIYRLPDSHFACLGSKKRQELNGAVVIISEDENIVTTFWRDHRFTSLSGGER